MLPRVIAQRLYNSPYQRLEEGLLDLARISLSALGLWISQSQVTIRFSTWTTLVSQFNLEKRQHVTLTWRNGPIFVSTNSSGKLRNLVITRYTLCKSRFSSDTIISRHEFVRKYCAIETSSWIQLMHKSQTLFSSTIFRISLGDHAVDLSLL